MEKMFTLKPADTMLELDGKTYKMDFDMMALAKAEQVCEQRFFEQLDTMQILAGLVQNKTRAIMALAYGALTSAGEKVTWERFAKEMFTFDNFEAIASAVADGVAAMFDADEEDPEASEKNADSRGAN